MIHLYQTANRSTAAGELAAQLRGQPVFDAVNRRRDEYAMRVVGVEPGQFAAQLPRAYAKHHVAFVDLGAIIEMPQLWQNIIEMCRVTILDVHFPLGAAHGIRAIQPGRTDETRDAAECDHAQEFWSQPEVIERAHRMLRQADVVTTPHRGWRELLIATKAVYGGAARVLPDVTDPHSGGRFLAEFWRCIEVGYSEPASWLERLRARIGRRAAADLMRGDLAAIDVDWAARKRGVA